MGCGVWSHATGGEQFVRLWWADTQAQRLRDLEKPMANTYLMVSPDGVLDGAAAR